MNLSSPAGEWWEALRSGLGSSGEAAGLLFRYDPRDQALCPCFPKSAGFDDIPSRAVEELYETARCRGLVALRPADLAPCLVTADASALLHEPPPELRQQARRLAGGMMEQIREYMHRSQTGQSAGSQRLRGALHGSGDGSLTNELLRSVYAARQAAALANAVLRMPAAQSLRGEADDLMWRAAVLSAQAEAVLSQCLRDEEEEKDRQQARERSRQYLTAEILAQREARATEYDAPRSAPVGDVFSSLRAALADAEPPEEEAEPTAQEKTRANDVMQRLHQSARKGGKAAARQVIDRVASGREPMPAPSAPPDAPEASANPHNADAAVSGSPADALPEEPRESGASVGRGTMLGNALRQFAQYAAGEVPLSVKHVETGRLCRTFLAMAREERLTPADLGLSPAEYAAVLGTIQLGLVVERGLEASDTLLSGGGQALEKKFLALRNYLSMKAVEQVLLSHAAAHQQAIAAGDAPLSPIQMLMGNSGFSARDIHRAVAGSGAMEELFSAPPDRLAFLLRSRSELSELARRAMAACYGAEPAGSRTQERAHAPAHAQTNRGPAR